MLPHMLYGADVLLVSQLPEVMDIVVPSKLVTAMGAGAMIVAACAEGSETAQLLARCGGGLVVQLSNDGELSRVLLLIKNQHISTSEHRMRVQAFAAVAFGRKKVYGRFRTH